MEKNKYLRRQQELLKRKKRLEKYSGSRKEHYKSIPRKDLKVSVDKYKLPPIEELLED